MCTTVRAILLPTFILLIFVVIVCSSAIPYDYNDMNVEKSSENLLKLLDTIQKFSFAYLNLTNAEREKLSIFQENLKVNLVKLDELRNDDPVSLIEGVLAIILNQQSLFTEALRILDLKRLNKWTSDLFQIIFDGLAETKLDFRTTEKAAEFTSKFNFYNSSTKSQLGGNLTSLTAIFKTISPFGNTTVNPNKFTMGLYNTTANFSINNVFNSSWTIGINYTSTLKSTTQTISNPIYFIDGEICESLNAANCKANVEIPLLCPFLCKCGNLTCENNGLSAVNSNGKCICICDSIFSGDRCEKELCKDHEFCVYFNEQDCANSIINEYCPTICSDRCKVDGK